MISWGRCLFKECQFKIVDDVAAFHDLAVGGDGYAFGFRVGGQEGIDHAADHHALPGGAHGVQLLQEVLGEIQIQRVVLAFHGAKGNCFIQYTILDEFFHNQLRRQLIHENTGGFKAICLFVTIEQSHLNRLGDGGSFGGGRYGFLDQLFIGQGGAEYAAGQEQAAEEDKHELSEQLSEI